MRAINQTTTPAKWIHRLRQRLESSCHVYGQAILRVYPLNEQVGNQIGDVQFAVIDLMKERR